MLESSGRRAESGVRRTSAEVNVGLFSTRGEHRHRESKWRSMMAAPRMLVPSGRCFIKQSMMVAKGAEGRIPLL